MAEATLVHDYLDAMSQAQGERVSAMFTETGVIDDYRGGHRVGRDVIRDYMNTRPPRDITFLSDVIVEGRRLTAYTRMAYQDGRGTKTVRFIFTLSGDLIEHLVNTEVESVPEEFRIVPS